VRSVGKKNDYGTAAGGLDPAFEGTIFPQELKSLEQRSSARTRAEGDARGLPDFEAHCFKGGTTDRSPFFEHTLELLTQDDQNAAWKQWVAEDPENRHGGLTGLALSGGGIRSATLNLGIVQVLEKTGLFYCLDYLSTVSGGGYLGGSISANYSGMPDQEQAPEAGEASDAEEPAAASDDDLLAQARGRFPFRHERGRPEPAGFLQLRNFSSYLVPKGFIDYMRLPVQVIRGILVNFLVLLPWIILFAILASLFLQGEQGSRQWNWAADISPMFTDHPFSITLSLFVVFGALALIFPVARRIEIWQRGEDASHRFRKIYESGMVVVLLLSITVAFVELQPVALNALENFQRPAALASSLSILTGVLATLGNFLARRLKSLIGRWGLYLVALLGAAAFWLLFLLFTSWFLDAPGWWSKAPDFASPKALFGGVAMVLLVWSFIFVSANALSMHNFYRDRLAKAFLFRVDRKQRSADHTIDPRLSELSTTLGPLHLVNTALNTREFPQMFRKGRHAEPFFLSGVCSGSRITGYCATGDIEKTQKDVRLSTAVATSGAAASSHMGVYTNAAVRFILSVLNVRLGYWLINPMYFAENRPAAMAIGRLFSVGVGRFFQELLGVVTYKTSYVYLSDGGHIENLGIYELVRRQCRFIVAGDGECDPEYTFKGLADAIRLIRVDFGIIIEMDGLDEIRNGQQQFARGTIHYPDGRLGYLIYLKSSLLGDHMVEATVSREAYVTSPLREDDRHFDELSYVAHYKARHPDFPQETTGDQFFDETQFEVYRALGYLVADRAFTWDK
jgi:hypothetical protein